MLRTESIRPPDESRPRPVIDFLGQHGDRPGRGASRPAARCSGLSVLLPNRRYGDSRIGHRTAGPSPPPMIPIPDAERVVGISGRGDCPGSAARPSGHPLRCPDVRHHSTRHPRLSRHGPSLRLPLQFDADRPAMRQSLGLGEAEREKPALLLRGCDWRVPAQHAAERCPQLLAAFSALCGDIVIALGRLPDRSLTADEPR